MAISYNKLWNLVRQNKMKKGELAKAAGISDYMMSKLNKDEPVQMEIMIRLCKVFHCDIGKLHYVFDTGNGGIRPRARFSGKKGSFEPSLTEKC